METREIEISGNNSVYKVRACVWICHVIVIQFCILEV